MSVSAHIHARVLAVYTILWCQQQDEILFEFQRTFTWQIVHVYVKVGIFLLLNSVPFAISVCAADLYQRWFLLSTSLAIWLLHAIQILHKNVIEFMQFFAVLVHLHDTNEARTTKEKKRTTTCMCLQAQCVKCECEVRNRMILSLLVLHLYTLQYDVISCTFIRSLCIRKSNPVYRLQFWRVFIYLFISIQVLREYQSRLSPFLLLFWIEILEFEAWNT